MFFEDLDEIQKIAKKTSCAIFVVPPEINVKLENTFYLRPEEKKRFITVEQMRNFLELANVKQKVDQFFIITPADAMNEAAQNAFLKTLEEPNENYHFLLLTEHPTKLLATIRSRAALFIFKKQGELLAAPKADQKVKTLAKKLIRAKPNDLVEVAEKIAKNKEARAMALSVTETAIEITYKTFFITKDKKFLHQLKKLLTLYQNLQNNGHVKLHIVADLC